MSLDKWILSSKDSVELRDQQTQMAKSLFDLIKEFGFEYPYENNKKNSLVNFVFHYLQNNKVGTLLFSPSCSSFDQFKNYEERGDHFKKLISEKLNVN